jgi:hypothetical protein
MFAAFWQKLPAKQGGPSQREGSGPPGRQANLDLAQCSRHLEAVKFVRGRDCLP